ncbi:MAG: methyltransferase domain-containing protein [Candidatus Binatia bacterium]
MIACRACKSSRLNMFLPLGSHPLANGFLRKQQIAEEEATFPLDTHVCLDCGLIQVRDNVPPGYFRNYVYVPSASEVMHGHFADLADAIAGEFLTSADSLTIDIGCNDGLFLKCLKDRGARTLGVDPATNIIQVARQQGLEIINEYFNPEIATGIRETYGPASVILTTNTFHHVDDLDSFTEGVRLLLNDSGVFIIEVPHALELVEQNEFDGVYHEHVSQFTVKSFVDLFRRFDLEVFRVDRLDVHGGSVRVFVRKGKGGDSMSPAVSAWLSRGAERGLFSESTYTAFRERVEEIKETLLTLLSTLKGAGKRVVGYGASARGNTLLNYYIIGTDLLDYIVDRNSLKHGLYSPGMHIPVFGVEKLLEDRPDYVLILAWNFGEEIMRQQEEYRRLGGRFIFPIPEPRIINGEGVEISQAPFLSDLLTRR